MRGKDEIIPITFDYVFTSIFNNPDNIIILENFLSCYLDIPLKEMKGNLKIHPRNLEVEDKKVRQKQVDLILDYKGKKINIELNNSFSESILKRNIVYACNIHARQLKKGDNKYADIKETIQINLNNIKKRKSDKISETYYLKEEETNEVLDKSLRIDIINMEIESELCYTKREKSIRRWCQAFKSISKEVFLKEIGDDLMEEKAKDKLESEVKKYSEDDECYALYSDYTKEELEYNTLMYDAKQEGIKEGIKDGIKEGEKQKAIEIAKTLKEKGFSEKEIKEITGLKETEYKR